MRDAICTQQACGVATHARVMGHGGGGGGAPHGSPKGIKGPTSTLVLTQGPFETRA